MLPFSFFTRPCRKRYSIEQKTCPIKTGNAKAFIPLMVIAYSIVTPHTAPDAFTASNLFMR